MIPIIIIVVLVVLIGTFIATQYNALVKLRNLVDNAWAQIDVQLKRRNDLIPNLVETVKGYAAHEKDALQAVIAARNMATSATGPQAKAQADNVLTGALKSLFAVSEAYPNLKANQNFMALQEELTATEDKIAYARQYYNDSTTRLNTKIESFPSMLFAGMAKAVQREYFEAEPEAHNAPSVQF